MVDLKDHSSYQQFIDTYGEDPVGFAQDFYCDYHPEIKSLDDNQKNLLISIANNKATSARSGTGTGKTSALVLAAAWFLLTRPLSMIIVTGPKFDQIKDTFWNEFQRWQLYSPMGKYFKVGSDKIQPAFANTLAGKNADMWCIMARTCREPQGLAGLHAEDSLFICDEASAIDDLIYEVIEGNLTKDRNKIVLTGQPNAISGYYFDSHHKDKDQWSTLHFDSELSPIADPKYCARMAQKYGKTSDVYLVRVKGEFPSGNPKAFIQYADIMAAAHRELKNVAGPFELGVDVARFGDDLTAIAIRRANKLFPIQTYSKLDTVQVAARVIDTVREYRKITGYSGPVRVKIDDSGVGGGVTDILKRNREDKIIVIPINFGSSPKDGVHADMASKMWKEFADQIKYLEVPNDNELHEELSTRRRAVHSGGLVKVESKDSYKADYGSSPDRADATILSFSRGAEAKKVWPAFHSWSDKHCRNFTINWKRQLRANSQVYVTLYQEQDLTTNALCCLWDGQDGKLYVFQEIVSPNPRPENIVPRIRDYLSQQFRDHDIPFKLNKFLWYANQEMFGLTEKATTMKGMRDGSATAFETKEYGLFLQPNLMLDIAGAQAIAGSMIASNMVVVHSNCEETVRQFMDWRIENGKPVEIGCGLCMALCNIVSLLHQWGKANKFLTKLPAYSPQKEYNLSVIEQADKEGVLTQLEARKAGLMLPQKPRPGLEPVSI